MPFFYHYVGHEALAGILRDGITHGGAVMRDAPDGRKRIGLTKYRHPMRMMFFQLPWLSDAEKAEEQAYWDEQWAACGNADTTRDQWMTACLADRVLQPAPSQMRITVALAEDDPNLSNKCGPNYDTRREMWFAHIGTIPPSAIKEVLDVETGVVLWPS